MQRRLLEIILLVASLAWSGLLLAATPIDETRPLNPNAQLSVENVSGSVTITGWDRNEMHLTGNLGEGVEDLVITGDAEHLKIRVEYPDEGNAEGSRLEIKVPWSTNLEVTTVSADINVRELANTSLDVQSVSGDVQVLASTEELALKSVSGDLKFKGEAGETRLETVSGDLEVRGLSGAVRLKTVSGDASIRAGGPLTSLTAKSVSGDISAGFAPASGADVGIGTLSGEVTLILPADTSARLEASSFSGDIESEFGSVAEDASSMNATLGAGDAEIEIESFSGEIEVRKQ